GRAMVGLRHGELQLDAVGGASELQRLHELVLGEPVLGRAAPRHSRTRIAQQRASARLFAMDTCKTPARAIVSRLKDPSHTPRTLPLADAPARSPRRSARRTPHRRTPL